MAVKGWFVIADIGLSLGIEGFRIRGILRVEWPLALIDFPSRRPTRSL